MKDIELLNKLEIKVRDLVSSLKKERKKNRTSEKAVHESMKLSQIEEKVRNLINLVYQLEQK
jgi:hypothetical protein